MSDDEKPQDPGKVKTILLAFDLSDTTYTVVKVTDSVEFYPGGVLTKDTVEGLCLDAAWKVTVQKFK